MRKIIAAVMLLGLMLIIGGCKKKEEVFDPDVISLGTQPTAKFVEAYGMIRAGDIKNVTIGFPAGVEEVMVKNGQKISLGEVLMVLNTKEYEAQLDEINIDLDIMKEQNKENNDMEDKIAIQEKNLTMRKEMLNSGNIKEGNAVSDVTNGVVLNIINIKGDLLYPGSKLFSIANLESTYVSVNIEQQFIRMVEMGARVEIIPEYDKSKTLKGEVSFISSKAILQNGETVIPVEINIDSDISGILLDTDVLVKIFPLN